VTAVATPRSADVTDDTRIVARRVLVEVSFWEAESGAVVAAAPTPSDSVRRVPITTCQFRTNCRWSSSLGGGGGVRRVGAKALIHMAKGKAYMLDLVCCDNPLKTLGIFPSQRGHRGNQETSCTVAAYFAV